MSRIAALLAATLALAACRGGAALAAPRADAEQELPAALPASSVRVADAPAPPPAPPANAALNTSSPDVTEARRAIVALLVLEPDGGRPEDDPAWSGAVELLITALEVGEGAPIDDWGVMSVLLGVVQHRRLPDAMAKRLLGLARSTRLRKDDPFEYDQVLAEVLAQLPVERLGLLDDLRDVAGRHPGTKFQRTLLGLLRSWFPESPSRVAILSDLLATGDPVVALRAIDGLTSPSFPLPAETCAALGRGARRSSPRIAFQSLVEVAAGPCGLESAAALDAIEARVREGPLLADVDLSHLCAHALPDAGRVRPMAVLHSVARSSVEPLEVRKHAMFSVRFCNEKSWKLLLALLRGDPDEHVRATADYVDRWVPIER